MLKKLDETWFDAMYQIMEEAFPPCERRTKEGQRALFSIPQYEVYGWFQDQTLVAFLDAWDLGEIRFGEHLATGSSLRNKGIGKSLFQEYERLSPKPLVFEVELPDNDLARRRIAFYERLGYYCYDDVPYYQGSLNGEEEPLPLYLMMNRKDCNAEDINRIIDLIYAYVYRQQRYF